MSILDAILEVRERTVRLSVESSDPIRDLAQYYADLLNTFLHGMVKEPSDLLDLAEQDLEGTPYKLKRDQNGFWQVVRATMMFSVMRRIIWLGAQRSPKGGITIQGKFYRGGQFIPGKVIAKASPEEKAKLEARKQQDDINAAERKQERLKRGVDVAKLKATLDQHKSSLSARQMGNAKRAFHALKRHHGDAVFHRIEEIANILTEQLAANEGRDWLTTQLRSKIAGLSQMVEMAESAGITPPEAEKPKKTAKPKKEPVAKARTLFSIVKQKGGLDPEQLKRNYGPESIKQEGLLGVTLKGGIGIDDMAATLVAEGHIVPPPGVNETDYLWEQLKAKAITLHDAGDYYEQQFEREYEEYVRQAQQAQIPESDIAEAIRSGEEEGEIEGGESEWFEAVGELAEESGSFDFGANVEEEKPKEPWEMTTKDFDAAIIGKAEEMINSGDKKYRGKSGSLRALAEASAIMRGGRGNISHEALVKSAIKTGKTIPPEVMSEYPHLKKPHERTQAEYDKVYNQEESRINRRSSGIGTLANDPQPTAPGMTWGQWSRMNDVERALRQNKPVPPEVLADYPDLAAKYGIDQLAGGKADNMPDEAFSQDKLAQGTQHEGTGQIRPDSSHLTPTQQEKQKVFDEAKSFIQNILDNSDSPDRKRMAENFRKGNFDERLRKIVQGANLTSPWHIKDIFEDDVKHTRFYLSGFYSRYDPKKKKFVEQKNKTKDDIDKWRMKDGMIHVVDKPGYATAFNSDVFDTDDLSNPTMSTMITKKIGSLTKDGVVKDKIKVGPYVEYLVQPHTTKTQKQYNNLLFKSLLKKEIKDIEYRLNTNSGDDARYTFDDKNSDKKKLAKAEAFLASDDKELFSQASLVFPELAAKVKAIK